LAAVANALPLAAHLADHDVEHVHRLRVASRRAIAALKLYRDWLPRKPARWLKKRLNKVRRAAGEARDFDVLSSRLERNYGRRAQPVVRLAADRRADVQAAILKAAEFCRYDDRFIRKTAKLLAGVKWQQKDQSPARFRDWATQQLDAAAASFFSAMPTDASDKAALHQFRIRGKELRYTTELLMSAFGPELRNCQYPIVEELQERLGRVQDHVTAIGHLCEWADDKRYAEHEAVLRELAEEERERLIDEIRDYQLWWSDERAEELRIGLSRANAREEVVTETSQAARQT
jgi:CHAD domain-containing protein